MPRGGKGGGSRPEMEAQADGEAEEGEVAGGAAGMVGEDKGEPTIADLTNVLRAHMGQQQAREARWEQEMIRQEKRFKTLQHQFSLLQLEVQARTTPEPSLPEPSPPGDSEVVGSPVQTASSSVLHQQSNSQYGQSHFSKEPKLQKLTESDDIEHFLITFERMAVACGWPKTDWGFHLIPLLTGKARSAYVYMDVDDSLDYDKVKCAILKKYDINPETYRQAFRSLNVEPEETPKELYVRLKELYGKWVQPKNKTVNEIGEIIILEQYLRMLSPELQIWIKEHDPKSAADAAKLADVFVAARRKNPSWFYKSSKAVNDGQKPAATQHGSRSSMNVSKPPVRLVG